MAEVLIPVGHDVGPFYAAADTELPHSFSLRCATNALTLGLREYAVWDSLRGELTNPEDSPKSHTRQTLTVAMAKHNIRDVNPIVDQLIKIGAITSVDTSHDLSWTYFAESHRVFPLGAGLGNTAPAPWLYRIKADATNEIIVTDDTYRLWTFSHLYRSLWDACQALSAGQPKEPEDPELITTPDDLLNEVVAALPHLLATKAVYIDRSL